MPNISKEKSTAITHLREILKPGDTVYAIMRTYLKTGQGIVDLVASVAGQPVNIGRIVSVAIDGEYDDERDGIRLVGTHMNAPVLVHYLSLALYPKGFDCPGNNCPHHDHDGGKVEIGHHPEGGHALRRRWL